MKRIIIICGPTGVGKTPLAVRVAQKFNGEIVGADSMQIYRHLNIGTAKPDPEEMDLVRHHLIDCIDPKDEFDAGRYVKLADKAIQDITSRGKIPIITGGTGLYIKALLNGLFRSESICTETLSRLALELKEKGVHALYEKLSECDPKAADRIHPNDSFRVIRAIEVFQTTGNRISDYQKRHSFHDHRYESLKIGLYLEREKLYDRINQRVDMMMNKGLLNEVLSMVENGYSFNLKSMQSIGYKHMAMFIQKKIDLPEAINLLKRDTRRYAKRQFTWFNKDKDIAWYNPLEINGIEKLIKDFLT
ncbi:MAG: tRNA (adenosine(37)-N6)-dimethylallyltransferase MiaA [Desulfobacterales bacterium RIFOXYA12_FULL_46_15]|nr:MAG: tRNA (adenosine(37)-N6)-dimethylallyltransferase MiaA [Desulfobacterales bacterium RIFOXYA12_FULL_46_15]